MKHFKKHPLFTAVFALLLAIFVAGIVYDGILLDKNEKAQKGELKARKSYETALKNDPTQKTLDEAEANLVRLREHLNLLDKDLSRDNSKVLAPCPAKAGFELLELLVQKKNQWTSLAQESGVAIPDNFSFSFGRYLADGAKPPADSAVPAIWRQASILENILTKLYSSKPKDSEMSIVLIQREVLPEETDVQAASRTAGRRTTRYSRNVNASETFEVPQYITARKKGSISALGYKIVFTGYTDAMRNFLNKLNGYDLMLVVRSVEVKPFVGTALRVKSATPETPSLTDEAALAAAFEATDEPASAAETTAEVAAPVKDPVVTENVSEFTFIIEYVEVDKAQMAAPSDKESAEESEEKPEDQKE